MRGSAEDLCCAPRQSKGNTKRYLSSAPLIPHYDPANLAEVQQATAGETLVIENAYRSLEIMGEIVESVRVLERIMLEIQKFLG